MKTDMQLFFLLCQNGSNKQFEISGNFCGSGFTGLTVWYKHK